MSGWAGLGEALAGQVGWLVGFLEQAGNVYFFATNSDIRNGDDAKVRLAITKAILHELKLID
jgi:beta-lactamase class D